MTNPTHTYIFTTLNGPRPSIEIEVTVEYEVYWDDDGGALDFFSVVAIDGNPVPESERQRTTDFFGDGIIKNHADEMVRLASEAEGERQADLLDRRDEAWAEAVRGDQ